jgi:hypothetical protein
MSDNKAQGHPNDVEKNTEHPSQTKEPVESQVHKEVDKGKEDLVRAQKEHDQHLKSGGKSGISGMFGKAKEILADAVNDDAKHVTDQPHKSAAAQDPARKMQLEMDRGLAPAFAVSLDTLVRAKDAADVVKILKDKTPEQLYFIEQSYKNIYGRNLEDDLKGKLSGSDLTQSLDLLHKAKAPENSVNQNNPVHTDATPQKTAPPPEKPGGAPAETPDKAQAEAQQKAIEKATAPTYFMEVASAIQIAPDPSKVLDVLKSRSPFEVAEIKELYRKAYHTELDDDIRERFGSNPLASKIFDTLHTPPEKRMSEAKLNTVTGELFMYSFVQADADKVIKVLQNSTESEIEAYKTQYKRMTGLELEDRVKAVFEGNDLKRVQHFLNHKDNDAAQLPAGVDRDSMLKADIEIQAAAKRTGGLYDVDTINKLLADKKPEELKAMDALYKERYGISLNDQFMAMVPATTFEQRVAMAHQWKTEQVEHGKNEEVAKIFAVGMLSASGGQIEKILAGKTEVELKDLDARFRSGMGTSLDDFLKSKFEGAELQKLLDLAHHKDASLSKLPDGVDRSKLREANEAIYHAEQSPVFGKVMPETYEQILAGKTPAEIEAMKTLFKERYGEELDQHLKENGLYSNEHTLDGLVHLANVEKTKEAAFKADTDKVESKRIEKLAEELHQTKEAETPFRVDGNHPVVGWPPGEHPAEKLIQQLSAAELRSLNAAYREKYGHDIKDDFSDEKAAVGERLERTLNRDYKGALDKLSPQERADARTQAETIYRAMLPHDQPGGEVKKEDFFAAMEKQSPEKRAAIEEAFHELSGGDLKTWIKDKFSGYKQEKALNYFKYGDQDEAGKIHLALGDKDPDTVRKIISMMNSKEIEKLDAAYKEHYNTSLHDALDGDDNLSAANKKALEIYMQGTDYLKVHPEEWTKLMEVSIGDYEKLTPYDYANNRHSGDLEMFKDIMSSAPPEMRVAFIANGGMEKVVKAFGLESKDALEYLAHGGLSLEQQIKKNIGFVHDDHEAITKAADDNHGDLDHQDYIAGAAVFQKYYGKLDDSQKYGFEFQARMNDSSIPNLPNMGDMNDEEKRVYEKYQEINTALNRGLYNENGIKFRDHIINSGGVDGAIDQIQNMKWDDLQALKDMNPLKMAVNVHNFMVKNHYDLMSEGAQKQIREELARRLSANKPEDLTYAHDRSFDDALDSTRPKGNSIDPMFFLNPAMEMPNALLSSGVKSGTPYDATVLKAIENMSLEDQRKYRSDEDFRDKVNNAIERLSNDSYKLAANHMLQGVLDEKVGNPHPDYIDRINIEAGNKETDEPQVLRYAEDEMRKNPGILHPKTYEDVMLRGRLDNALHNALDADEYERWAQPVLENGRLTIEQKLDIDKEKGDQKSVFTDIRKLASAQDPESVAEHRRIVNDEYYRDHILGDLNPEQRELAENILKQGGLAPEDIVRSYILDTGVSKEQMLGALGQLKGKDIVALHEQYALKYHDDINQVLSHKLSGDDKKNALYSIRLDAATARQAAEDAYEEVSKSNNGFGASFTKWWSSGAGDLAANKLEQLQAKIQAESANGKELSVDEAKQLAKDAHEYTQMFDKAKEKAAEEFADYVITAASFIAPGGIELKMLIFATAGGLAKVGIKEAIAGDASPRDFVSGFVASGLAAIGPGEMAAAAGVGKKVALEAEIQIAAKAGNLLADGAEKRLAGEMEGAAARAFAHDGGTISNEALDKIVNDTIKSGATQAERDELRKVVVDEIVSASKKELIKGIPNALVREGLATGSGYVGGFAGGVTEAVFDWDSSKSFTDNMSQILEAGHEAAKGGAFGAFVIGNGLKLAGKGFHYLRRTGAVHPPEGVAAVSVAEDGNYSVVRPENAPPPSGNPIDADAGNFERVGNSDYYLGRDGHVYKSLGKAGEGQLRVIADDAAQIAISDEALAKTKLAAETASQAPDTAKQTPETAKQAPDTAKQAPETTARPEPRDAQGPHEQVAQHPHSSAPQHTGGETGGRSKPGDTLHGTGAGDTLHGTGADDTLNRDEAGDTLHGMAVGATLHDMKVPVEELNLPPEVIKKLDQASIPPDERAALIDWVSKNKLSSPEVMAEFTHQVYGATSKWHDLSVLPSNLDNANAQLNSAYKEYTTRLTDRLKADNVPEADIPNLLANPDDLRNRFSSEPELVQTIDHFKNAREVSTQTQFQLDDVVSGRVLQMQEALDQLADKQGLPRVKIQAVPDEFMGPASGLYFDGAIKVRRSDLLKMSDPASFMETTYHEFVHNQQDSLVVRSAMDDVEKQTGAHLQPQDIDRLRQLQKQLSDTKVLPTDQFNELMRIKKAVDDVSEAYKAKTGWNISDEHLKEVIRAREDRVLSPEERFRAEQLSYAFKNMANPGAEYGRAVNDQIFVNNELQNLKQPGGAEDLVKRLAANDPELSRQLFDKTVPPPEVQELIKQYVRDGFLANPDPSARIQIEGQSVKADPSSVLQHFLDRQNRILGDYQGAIYQQYISGFHEQEAWILGKTVEIAAREQGMGPQVAVNPPYSNELPPSAPAGAGAPSIKFDAPTTPPPSGKLEAPAASTPAPQAEISTAKIDAGSRQPNEVLYKVGDTQTELYENGGWYYPRRDVPTPPLDRGVKIHVFATGNEDLARLQEVLIPALQNDPVLRELVPEWKTLDPRFRDPKAAAAAGRSPDGAAFTIGVKDPADLAKVQARIDEIISEHPELKLQAPPQALNKFAGTSNRVGTVRDFWPASELPSETVLDSAKLEEYKRVLEVKPGERFSPDQLAYLEHDRHLKLRYDDAGNLLVREVGAQVDSSVVTRINESFNLSPGERLSPEQIKQVESKSGIKEGSLSYDQSGNLVLKGTPGESIPQGDNYFLQIRNAERHARGEEYVVKDKSKQEEKRVTSQGLTDQPAMYKLSTDYGVEPVDAYVESKAPPKGDGVSKPAETVIVGGKSYDVIGEKDGVVSIRESGSPNAPVKKIFEEDLPPRGGAEGAEQQTSDNAPTERDKVKSLSLSPDDADKYLRAVDEGRASAKNSDLSKPRVMDAHLERVETTAAHWKDQSELITRADESYAIMRDAQAKYRNEVIQKLEGNAPERELRSVDSVRKLISGDPEKLALLDEYVAARRANAETQKALVAAVKERTGDIQKMMDQLADSQGLPHVKVKLTVDGRMADGARGLFNHYDGTLELRRSDFMGKSLSASDLNTMYHEFVHSEQNALILRSIAEDIKVSKDLTPAEVEQLRSEFKKRVDSDISPARIDEVLGVSRRKDIKEIAQALEIEGGKGKTPSAGDIIRIQEEYAKRSGRDITAQQIKEDLDVKEHQSLTAKERQRAHELTKSLKTVPDANAFHRIANDLAVVDSWRDKLASDPQAPELLIKELANGNSTLAAHLFKFGHHFKTDGYINLLQSGAHLPDDAAEELLEILESRHDALEALSQKMLLDYRSSQVEQEAFAIGEKMEEQAGKRASATAGQSAPTAAR